MTIHGLLCPSAKDLVGRDVISRGPDNIQGFYPTRRVDGARAHARKHSSLL